MVFLQVVRCVLIICTRFDQSRDAVHSHAFRDRCSLVVVYSTASCDPSWQRARGIASPVLIEFNDDVGKEDMDEVRITNI